MFGKDKAEGAGPGAHGGVKAAPDAKGAGKAGGEPSLISADMKVVGNMQSAGDIQIDGTVKGDIKSRTLTVGESAYIQGSISAESVNIFGRISGQVSAAAVRVANTANVQGDITYKTLVIEEDAVLDGQIRRMDPSKPAAAEAKPGAEATVTPLKAASDSGRGASGGASGSGGEAKPASGAGGGSSPGASAAKVV